MSHGSRPLISIIVAVLNGKETLQQCIDSVAQQSYPNKELIVIDGGSKDGTLDLLNANREKITYWISEPDRGIYSAWNKGLAQAKGEWIYFLGADDFFWDAQALAQMSGRLEELPSSVQVAYGQIMLISAGGKVIQAFGEPWENLRDRFRQVMCIPHQGTMHRRSLFERHGKFDESFRIAGDYELLLRELKTGDAVFIRDCIVAAMRVGGIGSTPANSLLVLRETRRAARMHGQALPGWFYLKAMGKEYFRLLLWMAFGGRLARKLLDLRRRIRGLPPYWTNI
jgi:glycosyltransferase involved in cell wall biosynthesis